MEESPSPLPGPDLPECPVCLQPYDSESTIPRVLPCGHTACEPCLAALPQKYPLTIRCPACTQLVKFSSPLGPASLPKNIDLLRLFPNHRPTTTNKRTKQEQVDSVSPPRRLWSEEFYATWKNRVLSKDSVLEVENEWFLRDVNRKVGVFKIGEVKGSVFGKTSYFVGILNLLHGMSEGEREELGLILRIGSKLGRFNEVYGLWADSGDGYLYLVFESLERMCGFESGFWRDDGLAGFAMVGMDICEAVMALHFKGLLLGCLGFCCFGLDGFGRVSLSLGEVLVMGRGAWEGVREVGLSGVSIGGRELRVLVGEFSRNEVFLSPEVLFGMLKKEGVMEEGEVECGGFGGLIERGSDVWSLGCVLLRLLLGKKFVKEVIVYMEGVILHFGEENGLDCQGLYVGLMEKVRSFLERELGAEHQLLQKILCRCLEFDPRSRPLVRDVWKCARELIFRRQFETLRLDGNFDEWKGCCLVLGELCQLHHQRSGVCKEDALQGPESDVGDNLDQVEGVGLHKGLVKGLVDGKMKSEDMEGHLDCITGLAIGGGFLFSSSFDKSVHIWSLQDFSHIHAFKGHEHKIMAITYVDEEEPLCVTGDSGGGIFLWSIRFPLEQEPIKIWYEKKDWRYSGIHALTTAGNGHLYTGSGDRSIKAWSLQDGTIKCTMDGHKSVVSTLTVCDGVLYSGSWDGTIRLWSLNDHSLLTVLGEDIPGTVTSVLSLKASGNILVAAHENGLVKVWRNDMLEISMKNHVGSIFAIDMDGQWLFTGGWDKIISVQEISEDEFQVESRPIGLIPGGSVITAMLCWPGKLFVGYGDRTLKVYYHG